MKFLLGILMLFFSLGLKSQESLFNHFSAQDGLLSNRVFDVLQDNKGSLWFATSKGIVKLDGFDFVHYNTYDEFNGDQLIGLHLGNNNDLWAYSSLGKLYRLQGKTFKGIALNKQIEEKWGDKIVNAFTIDHWGDLYLASVLPSEFLKISRKEKTLRFIPQKGNASYGVKQLGQRGNNFIYGSYKSASENKSVLFENLNVRIELPLGGNSGFSKSSFIKRQNNAYLFAVESEVINFTKEGILSRLFVEKNVESILEDSEGKIWIGLTQGGVVCFPNGDISSLNKIEYLGSKTITAIYEDNDRNLWFATANNGIYYMSLSKAINYETPKINSPSDTNEIRTVQARATGKLGQLDLTMSETFDTLPPKVFFSGIEINNHDTTIESHYDLEASQNFLKIGFVGSTLGNIGLFQYKYKMTGVDDDWVYTSANMVQYTMLPPGKYSFEVSAMNKAGVWSDTPAKVEFLIHPKYYQTIWFQVIVVVSVLAMLILFTFLYVGRVRKKEKEKLTLGKKIADLELSALRAQMNPHFIFNTLSSIQHFVATSHTEEALKYLSKFAKLMRVILDNSKRKEIPVKDELKAISLYLELEKLRFKDKFGFDIVVSDQLDESYDEIPSMLIQPYIENAILHGIMNKEGKGHIKIELYRKKDYMICSVEDNGVGRRRAMNASSKKSRSHKSQGMLITKDRLEIINKVNESNLSVEIKDLNPQDEDKGTQVKIYIPIHQN